MTHRILITALYGSSERSAPAYFCAGDVSGRTLYCDAFTPVEAGCKLLLSECRIDEIIVIGTCASHEGEEAPSLLREHQAFLSYDLACLSEYDLLRYRLGQFFEDINAEQADTDRLLNAEERERTVAFLHSFFSKRANQDGRKKYNRFFHYLMSDTALWEEFCAALLELVPAPETDLARYQSWILPYLYRELKATSKLEPLEENEDLRIRFFPDSEDATLSHLSRLLSVFREMEVDDEATDTTELYVCLQSDCGVDMISLLNSMNLTKVMPNAQIHVCRIIAEGLPGSTPVRVLCDREEDYGISELLAGTGTFLRYGKTDLLLDYWKQANLNNPTIERMLYGMRNIDYGISLCDIADIERGVKSLRSVIRDELPITGKTRTEQYFELAMESIRQDYGPLLRQDEISFSDLVRWAYRKGFWQQTLTLIESRAPADFVERGFFYYSGDRESRDRALEVFAREYNELRASERYKMEKDVSHYFIKFLNRRKAPSSNDADAYQLGYAGIRIAELDAQDSQQIRPLSICDDREALKELLFAYYHLGDVRNLTNHAREEFSGFYSFIDEADAGTRMKAISSAVDYFLHCYERVCDLCAGKEASVVTVTPLEVLSLAAAKRDEQFRVRRKTEDIEKGEKAAPEGRPEKAAEP